MYLAGDPPPERFFVSDAPTAPFVLWDADLEDELVTRLRARGVDALVIPDA
jgi:hypothetical protein